ncbi:aminotransferase class I/II-fold pyridoxal phosphate-dependent enzyme [Streptomonospora sp. PA3]|uniref:aminotransferase class I/II-fold pyridoxal phosphate-dependent enzyme n=1 Tax=Streptomonospora sp. PA3 TaxID=2607326 RepID=UPI0012DD22D3|nr:aminotransferase class I/II-fold pyridoxal phosphate-dependent enzyme [Streptomonospora sp. PA3]MUL42368.1 aminotransferase class I/II-fold pyridoxal phosphate-dependent enzyme [Streptomonospora sp. PA3]
MAITGRGSNEIADSVESAIADGRLGAGAALPPIRDLAGDLGVNPNTVAAAYRMLRERGLVETAGRRGTRVRPHPLGAPRETEAGTVPPGIRDAATGNPDPRLLPDLAPALAAAARRRPGHHALYGDPPLLPRTAEIAREIFAADGVPADQLAATSGALDGIDRVLRSSLRPGDAVVVEDPGWSSTLRLLTALGMRPAPVGVDDEGMLPDALRAALRGGARALVVTDRAQNPIGAALSPQRETALRAVLADHPDVLTVDDDHGFGFAGVPFHSLAGATRRWALVRSVAKAYGPDLRLALLAGDAVTAERVRALQQAGPGWVSTVLQEAFAELWRSRAVDPERVSRSYDERRDALVSRLAERGVAARGRSGVNVWVPVADEAAAVTALHARGWAVAPGRRFRVNSAPGIRVTVSAVDAAETDRLAADIASSVRAGGPPV